MKMHDAETFAHQAELAFKAAVRKALERHRRLGEPIAFMEDGKVIILTPESEPAPAAAAAAKPLNPRRQRRKK